MFPGIAADQGLIDLDAPLVSYFPDRTIANLDERKQAVTIRDLVSLTSGLECNPGGDEQDPAAMRATDDWVQAALDRPSVAAPGARFVYCGPDMHLLSGVLRQATGMTALEFARANLFGPLGITEAVWDTDPQGNNRGWGDLALLPQMPPSWGCSSCRGASGRASRSSHRSGWPRRPRTTIRPAATGQRTTATAGPLGN